MKYWVVQHCTIASSHNSSPYHKWNHKSKQWNSCKKIKHPTLGYLISNFAYIYHFQIKYLLYINSNFDKNRKFIWIAIKAVHFSLLLSASIFLLNIDSYFGLKMETEFQSALISFSLSLKQLRVCTCFCEHESIMLFDLFQSLLIESYTSYCL